MSHAPGSSYSKRFFSHPSAHVLRRSDSSQRFPCMLCFPLHAVLRLCAFEMSTAHAWQTRCVFLIREYCSCSVPSHAQDYPSVQAKVKHCSRRKTCSARFWHRSNLTTPLTSRRVFRCSPHCTIIAGTAPRILSQTDSVRASSHGWASSTRYGQVAHGQIDHLVDRLIGGENPVIARDGCRRVILIDSMTLVV
jgi:hypothetical protein